MRLASSALALSWHPDVAGCESAGALMASRFPGPQSTTPTPECAQTTTISGQRGFAPPNGTHLRQLQGDRACAVARKLTRKGWPLAANPWRALRKCNVRRSSPAANPAYHRDNLPSEHAHSCGRRRPEPTAAVVRKQRERTNSCQSLYGVGWRARLRRDQQVVQVPEVAGEDVRNPHNSFVCGCRSTGRDRGGAGGLPRAGQWAANPRGAAGEDVRNPHNSGIYE